MRSKLYVWVRIGYQNQRIDIADYINLSAVSASVFCELVDHAFEMHILNFWKIARRIIFVQVYT